MGAAALDRLDLEVRDGELLVLVGPSGCGKSTVLRLIAGLEAPTAGRVVLDGKDLAAVPPQDRDVAMVFQGYALYPHLTVAENVAFPLEMRGVPRAERAARVREAAMTVGLSDKLDRLPAELSGGERQRVAMARAIVRRPKLFLFDEPLSNLDAKLRAELRVELAGLVRRLGATALYVTHDQGEAMTMGDRIAVLCGGALMQLDAPRALYDAPANRFVAGFVGTPAMNLVDLDEAGSSGAVYAGARRADVVGFRPETVSFVDDAKAPLGDEGLRLSGKVVLVEPLGAETFVHVDAGGTVVRARVEGFGGPALGREVRAVVPGRALHWFEGAGQRVECVT
ncbi:MAG: ABC transporter ATP-binding protein [Deltaproteobacteria bacterium]|nr:ABC transporter ATP-binding protein [Deltaproteobacteria bacterium]